jgi:nucleoside-diphosphate-sugar epimerase
LKLVDELTPCDPQNAYEKSKLAAEQLAARGIKGCKVVILRPTNVVSEKSPGILPLARRSSFIDACKVFGKGGECAHLVHADDVAAAAMHFISYKFETPQCYIVSCDHEPQDTLARVWGLYDAAGKKPGEGRIKSFPHLPLWIPYLLRKIVRSGGNMGDVRYSSEKLLKTGFMFKVGLRGLVARIAAFREKGHAV